VESESESEDDDDDDDKHGSGDGSDDDSSVDSNLVDVPSVHAPEKDDSVFDDDDDAPKPWEIEHREGANYVEEEVPDFHVGTYEKPHIPEPEIPDVPDSSEALNVNAGDGDIWGAYLAKWKKPAAQVKPVAPVKDTTGYLIKGNYARPVVFDAGHYLAKSRELAPTAGTVGYGDAAAQGWWE
jgi:hypothetical protein